MRYAVAAVIGCLLVLIMFLLHFYMASQIIAWREMNAVLSSGQRYMFQADMIFTRYWYAIAPLVLLACPTLAAATWPGQI